MPGSTPGGSTTRSSTPMTRPAPTRRNPTSHGCAGARWVITTASQVLPDSLRAGGFLEGRSPVTATACRSAPSSCWSPAMARRSISAAIGNAAAKPPDHSRTRHPTRVPSWIRSTRSAACRFRAFLTSLRSSSAVRASWGRARALHDLHGDLADRQRRWRRAQHLEHQPGQLARLEPAIGPTHRLWKDRCRFELGREQAQHAINMQEDRPGAGRSASPDRRCCRITRPACPSKRQRHAVRP